MLKQRLPFLVVWVQVSDSSPPCCMDDGGCAAAGAGGGAAAAPPLLLLLLLRSTAWTHSYLWPALQAFLWQATLQYHDSRHPVQHLVAPT